MARELRYDAVFLVLSDIIFCALGALRCVALLGARLSAPVAAVLLKVGSEPGFVGRTVARSEDFRGPDLRI